MFNCPMFNRTLIVCALILGVAIMVAGYGY